jgi:hypothetical protein
MGKPFFSGFGSSEGGVGAAAGLSDMTLGFLSVCQGRCPARAQRGMGKVVKSVAAG